MPNYKYKQDVIGNTFGLWTVIEACEQRDKRNQVQYRCVCVCGRESLLRKATLVSGRSKGCIFCRNHHVLRKNGEIAK